VCSIPSRIPSCICHQPASRWIDNGSQKNNSDGQATGVDLPPRLTFLSRWKLSLPSTVNRRFKTKLDSVSLNVSSSSPFSFPFNNGVPPTSPITSRRQTTQRWPYYRSLTHQPLSMSRQRSKTRIKYLSPHRLSFLSTVYDQCLVLHLHGTTPYQQAARRYRTSHTYDLFP
jgi:hypothetical protein